MISSSSNIFTLTIRATVIDGTIFLHLQLQTFCKHMTSRRSFLKKAAFIFRGLRKPVFARLNKEGIRHRPCAGHHFMDAEHIVLLMQENRLIRSCYSERCRCSSLMTLVPYVWQTIIPCGLPNRMKRRNLCAISS